MSPSQSTKPLGRKIAGGLLLIVVAVAASVVAGRLAATSFATVGACLEIIDDTRAGNGITAREVACDSETGLHRVTHVAAKGEGDAECPSRQYGVFEGTSLSQPNRDPETRFYACLEPNLAPGTCYLGTQRMNDYPVSVRVAGCREPGAVTVLSRTTTAWLTCDPGQRAVTYPEPPLGYCLSAPAA